MNTGHTDRTDWVVAGLVALVIHAVVFFAVINARPDPHTIPDMPDTRGTAGVGGAGAGTGADPTDLPEPSIVGCDYRLVHDSARLIERTSGGQATPGQGRIGCPATLPLPLPIDSAHVRITLDPDGIIMNVNVRNVMPESARDSVRALASRWVLARPTTGRIIPVNFVYVVTIRR